MVSLNPERVLLVGDMHRQVEAALSQAMPEAQITRVTTYFEAIAELSANQYTSVLASAEPIERRPEAAVKAIRQMAPAARMVLFGHPTLEPLSRKMLAFGCDDYLITPATASELHQVFGTPVMRIAPSPAASGGAEPSAPSEGNPELFAGLPLAELALDVLAEHPASAAAELARRLSEMLAPAIQVRYSPAGVQAPMPPEGMVAVSHAVRRGEEAAGQVQLLLPSEEDANAARHLLSRLAVLFGRVVGLTERHNRLQRLAITDELTGLYNARYFRHFLARILDLAKVKRFAVSLFLFDIDDFKKYNDRFGHDVGDQILKQTASIIRRCCRDHDLVARIGGDEFAVVFWEKEGPRQPRQPHPVPMSRTPQGPVDVLRRFQRLLTGQQHAFLGPSGQGTLTISGSLAVFPFDGRTMEELIAAADKELVFKAKQLGKNRIMLVGSGEQIQSL